MPISVRFVVQSTIVLLAIGVVTLLAFVGLTTWFGERAQVFANEITDARETRISAVELRSALQSAESSQRGFLTAGNEIYLAPYDAAKAEAARQVARLTKQLAAFPEIVPMTARLSAVVSDKVDEMDRTVALKKGFDDAAAATLFRTNRGKALMDEANLFLTSIIRITDERIGKSTSEQQENATRLRWAAIGGAILIVIVVGMVTTVIGRYAGEVAHARDAVRNLNTSLELRVQERTLDLRRARDRAEALLSEVNHRVANSLALVGALVRLQANAVNEPSAKAALAETQARINAIAMVHKRLYTAGDSGWVELDAYLKSLLEQMEVSMRDEGRGSFLRYDLEPLKLRTDASINLAVIVSEWVTNAVKYAYPGGGGEVRVSLKHLSADRGELSVEDDGVGRSDAQPAKGTGLGSRLVTAMASTIGADIQYYARHPGLGARLTFPVTTVGSA